MSGTTKIQPKHKPKRQQLSAISEFTGRLIHSRTKEVKMCDWCGKHEAMWRHGLKKGDIVYLCFGCGEH